MFKENYYEEIKDFHVTNSFATIMDNYRHAGKDFNSIYGKKQDIYNLFDGVITFSGKGRDPGNHVIMHHNAKYIGGPDEAFYVSYYHLFKTENNFLIPGEFNPAGEIIGKMGNSGYCKTFDTHLGKWRFINEKELNDINSLAGVHLHLQIHQPAKTGEKTKIISNMIEKKIIIEDFNNHYFYQWGNVYINPDKMIEYVKYLQDKIK
jgi:murein DD-endopeptidase MepM/ murein hydrolase activator NlpD